MAIMPGASRVQKFSGNRHKRPITKIVLHTTEGSSWPGYGGGGSAPHFTVHRDGTIRQHIDTAYSAKALVNRSGGVETNNGGVIQIEFIGSCDRAYARRHGLFFTENATDRDLAGLARVLAWISKTHGVPLTANGLRWPTSNAAYATAPQRFSYAEWNRYRGVCGHTHVPENDHWDPGAFPVARLLRLAGGVSIPIGGGAGVPQPSTSKPDPARPWTTSPRVQGMSTDEVTEIQHVLLGFDLDLGKWGADGKYGDATGTAVKQLQTELDITADGVYGPGTETAVMTIREDVKRTLAITTQNQVEIREAKAEAKRAADIAAVNQGTIRQTNARLDPIRRGGKEVAFRQELADVKTILLGQDLPAIIRAAVADAGSQDPDELAAQIAERLADGLTLTVSATADDDAQG